MIVTVFLALVALCAFYSLTNWRAGVYLWLMVAIIQDPIRKITPGTPVYLSITFAPVYLAAFLGMMQSKVRLRDFTRRFRLLDNSYKLLVLSVVSSLAIVLISGRQSPVRSFIGALTYVGGIPAVLMGYFFLRDGHRGLDRLLLCFAVFTGVMLIGVPLENSGFRFSRPWLGTIGMNGVWRRWYSNTEWVEMISGFHRSPEIMGWHAMMMVLVCIYLVLRKPKLNAVWITLMVWGSYAVFLSGRRKMLLMMIVFLVVLPLVSGLRSRRKILTYLVPAVLLVIPGIVWLVDETYLMSFSTGLEVAGAKVAEKGIEGPMWLLGIVGPFGYGVGTVTQGAQHFGEAIDVPLVEGGFEKMMVELGLIGALSALLFGWSVIWTAMTVVRSAAQKNAGDMTPPFCFALIMANLSAFLIAFQFLGDPFIATFVGFLYGVLLSTVRMTDQVPIKPQQSSRAVNLLSTSTAAPLR
jgi:hypothetical protein